MKNSYNYYVNCMDVINEVIISLEALIYEKEIQLKDNIQEGLISNWNREQFTQVVRILFDNAIKYCDRNGMITVELRKEKAWISFAISNTGSWIPKESLPYVFNRFYNVDHSRAYDGSFGLGLAMAKEITNDYSGQILIDSDVSYGTKVTMRIKYRNGDSDTNRL